MAPSSFSQRPWLQLSGRGCSSPLEFGVGSPAFRVGDLWLTLSGQRTEHGRAICQLLAQELVLGCRLVQSADEGFDVGLEVGDLHRVSSTELFESADLLA